MEAPQLRGHHSEEFDRIGQSSGAVSEDGLHPVCRFALKGRKDVAVGIHRQADLTVAERLHHDPRVHALHEKQGRACVSKVVETHRWQAGALQQSMKAVRDVRAVGECASRAGEDQVVVDPMFSSCQAFRGLASAVSAQCAYDDRWHDKSSPTALRLRLDELRSLMRDPL
jgi:hypothetical protein